MNIFAGQGHHYRDPLTVWPLFLKRECPAESTYCLKWTSCSLSGLERHHTCKSECRAASIRTKASLRCRVIDHRFVSIPSSWTWSEAKNVVARVSHLSPWPTCRSCSWAPPAEEVHQSQEIALRWYVICWPTLRSGVRLSMSDSCPPVITVS